MNRVDIPHPDSFKQGVRVLLLMLRAKDGGSAKTDRRATKKIITQGVDAFDDALAELRALWVPDQRIYSTINDRDIEKAIRIFKYRQLDNDYFAQADRHGFYLDLENRWVSCLKDGKAATSSLFLFDVDHNTNEALSKYHDTMQELETSPHVKILDSYQTRNGAHVITEPFNPAVISNATARLLMRDSLMLWSY